MAEFVRQVRQLTKPIASRLAYLDIELTERCNNDCIHCCINLPMNDQVARGREMTTDQVKNILAEAAGLGSMQVRLTGGEPLLRPDFEELYLYARRQGLKVLIFTNARLLTPHLADLLARTPPRVTMEISVYGMSQESYEAVSRVPGSFSQFWRGVQLLLERRVPFVVKSVLLPENKAEIEEFEVWARTIPWMTELPHYSLFLDLRNRHDNDDKNRLIESLRPSPEEAVDMMTRNSEKYRSVMAEFADKFMAPPGDLLFPCGAGHGLSIDAYGRAQPCMGIHAPEMTYDLIPALTRRPVLAEALASFNYLREIRATNPDYLRRCAVCFLKSLCEQCPAKSWAEYGTLDTPIEYLCEMAHAQARWLGWLDDHEQGWTVINWKERIKKIPEQ